jgi:hypothetical protein
VRTSSDTAATGPWPEPEPEHASALDPFAEPDTQPSGSKGVSLGVAVLSVGYLMVLPVLLAVGMWAIGRAADPEMRRR